MRNGLVAYYRDGKLETLGESIKDIVIGYDMIPLIGLGRMRRRLEKRGSFRRVAIRPSATANTWALFRDGRPVAGFATFGGRLPPTRSSAAISACGYIDHWPEWTERDRCLLVKIFMGVRVRNQAGRALSLLRRLGFDVRRAEVARA